MTCFSHGGHSLRSLTYVLLERLQGLRDQELWCYRESGIEALGLSNPEKHKFHPRPDSLLHLPYEEYILGHLKFSAKGTKREVFRMPIPNELITADIRGEQYYKEYLEKVSKHQRYLSGEEGSDPDSPAPKPAKATKKSLSLVDEFVDEGIPEKEPRFDDEEADMQRVVEESLKSAHDTHRDPLPSVVFREPDSGKFQQLPEVQGKGKEKRHTPAPTEPSGHAESPLIYAELGLTDSDTESDKEVSSVAGSNPGDDAEPQTQLSHVGPNIEHMDLEAIDVSTQQHPKQMDEGWVILEEPGSSTRTLSSLQHLAKDFSFGDQFFNDKPSEAENEKTTAETEVESMVSITIHQDTFVIPPMTSSVIDLISRPNYPNDHQPLLETATATTTMTITTLPLPPQPQQGTTNFILIKRISELEKIITNLIQDNKHLEERLDSHRSCLYKLENLNIPQQVSKAVDEIVTDAVDWAIQAPLRNRFIDFSEADIKEILHQRMWETNSYKAHEDHMMLYKALEKSMNCDYTDELLTDLVEARRKKKKRHDSPKTPHGQSDQSKSTATLSSLKTAASAEYTAWTTTNTRLRPYVSSIPKDLHMDDDMAPDEQVHSSDDEDIENAHIPKVTIQSDFFFNKDLKYLRYGSKGGRPTLSILKMKAAYYPDLGLEKMVPDQMWIEEECKYDIAAIIEVFSMYGYDYMKNIVLCRADFNEHIIAKRDFKYRYPSNFEDLYLLNLQGHLNHLPPKDKKILTTAVNLWTRHLVIRQRVEDFQLGIKSYQTQLNLTKPR
nr:E-beta-farnesene synthase [Tanacetum cinerariifolium]